MSPTPTSSATATPNRAHAVGAAVNHEVAGEDHDEHDVHIFDVTPTEWIAWTPLLVMILVLGVYPQLLFEVTDPAVTEMIARLGEHLAP